MYSQPPHFLINLSFACIYDNVEGAISIPDVLLSGESCVIEFTYIITFEGVILIPDFHLFLKLRLSILHAHMITFETLSVFPLGSLLRKVSHRSCIYDNG